VLDDHLVRKIEVAIDFTFIYPLVEDLYSGLGRPSIADAKEKHGIRWKTLRGLEKLSMQAMLTFAAMNLKKLASCLTIAPKAY
jgi:hypothetical protein